MKKADEILRAIISDQQAARAGEWSSFFKGWEAVAGTDIAAHSMVKDVKQGSILVEVDHPGWLQILQMRKKPILAKIRQRYPALEINDMRILLSDRKVGNRPEVAEATESQDLCAGSKTAEERIEESEEYRDFKAMLERLKHPL